MTNSERIMRAAQSRTSELEAENQRLREALQEIANFPYGQGRASWEQKKIAIKALEAANEK